MNFNFKLNFYSVFILSIFLSIDCFTVCDVELVSSLVTYKGCRKPFFTDSMDEPKHDCKTIYRFSGIPYAEPPIGSLRFKKPVQKSYNEKTVINATKFGSMCMQNPPSNILSEDCLNLNIWTPTKCSSKKLSVIIWIHGGGFSGGTGSSDTFDGSLLALRDVIVVTINYRLGVWGFAFSDSNDAPGNMGLWDQALAIQWVFDNIESFGGNPKSITLMGESAGSISVGYHVVSPQSSHLFQRAILQSGSPISKWACRPKTEMYSVSRRFASSLMCDNNNTWFDCLKNKTSAELLTGQANVLAWNTGPWYEQILVIFGPIYGDEFINKSVDRALREGDFRKDINIMTAYNEMEALYFGYLITAVLYGDLTTYDPRIATVNVTKDKIFSDIKDRFIQNDTIGEIIANKYTESFGINPDVNTMRRAAVYALSDFLLACPTVLYGAYFKINSHNSGNVFQYRLTYTPSNSLFSGSVWADVTHGEDVSFVFGIPLRSDAIGWNANDKKISKIFLEFITHFAKKGIPPKINGNKWPAYSINSDNSLNVSYMEIHADDNRLGRVHVNQYRGPFTDFSSPFNSECLNFWAPILHDQF